MIKGQADPIETKTQFTDDLHGVKKILEDNYPFLSRTMKTRFTKLSKKLQVHLKQSLITPALMEEAIITEDSEDESDNFNSDNVNTD